MEPLPMATLTEAAGKLIGALAAITLGVLVTSPKLAIALFLLATGLAALAVVELL